MAAAPTVEAAIAALNAQRALLGDAVVDMAVAPLLAQQAAQRDAAAQQLRLVSVLFLDVVGSTALTQRLDPETVHEVMDGALATFRAVVHQHGGRVLQFAGDSLLAAFGHDSAHEDDAERAVRGGLALLAAGRAQGALVRERHGHSGFDVRVGVHTGMVLLGGGVDEGNTIRGMTVNIAARLEQTAPAGELRISHATWRHVQGLFDAQAQPPLQVKGHDGALASYHVLGPLPGAAARAPRVRGVDGVRPPMLGRQAELAQLLGALQTLRDAGAGALAQGLTVLADAGLGKSRLIDELDQQLGAAEGVVRLLARAHPATQLQPFHLLRDLLARRLRISDSDSADAAKAQFLRGLTPYFGSQGDTPAILLGQLVGLDFSGAPQLDTVDPRQLRRLGLAAFSDLLRGLAAEHDAPLLLVADDLHWADDASLDLLLQLMDAPLPLLVLGLARPALLERRPAWPQSATRHAMLSLQALAPDASGNLARALLQRLQLPSPALTDLLVKQSAGNPYYMEELLKMLIDDGVVDAAGPVWQVHAERLGLQHVPSTLTGVLLARLDSLAGGERHALQQASIVGSVFWDQAVAALDPQAPAALPELERKALVRRHDTSSFEGSVEQSFGHHLLHQVAYETLLKAQRRAGHAAAARWLAGRVSERAGEHLAATALHFRESGDHATAARWLADAAAYAASRYDNATALAHALGAQALLPAADGAQAGAGGDGDGDGGGGGAADADAAAGAEPLRLRWRLASIAAKAADNLADRTAQRHATALMLALADAPAAEPPWQAQALYTQGLLLLRLGQLEPALAAAQRVVALAISLGAAEAEILGHNLWLSVLLLRGDVVAGRERANAGLERVRAQGGRYRLQEARMLSNLAMLDHIAERYDRARQVSIEALALARLHHEVEIHTVLLSNLTSCEVGLGNHGAALAWAEQAEALGRQMSDRVHMTLAIINGAQALLGLRQPAAARARMAPALTELQACGVPHYEACCLGMLGDVLPGLRRCTGGTRRLQQGGAGLHRGRTGGAGLGVVARRGAGGSAGRRRHTGRADAAPAGQRSGHHVVARAAFGLPGAAARRRRPRHGLVAAGRAPCCWRRPTPWATRRNAPSSSASSLTRSSCFQRGTRCRPHSAACSQTPEDPEVPSPLSAPRSGCRWPCTQPRQPSSQPVLHMASRRPCPASPAAALPSATARSSNTARPNIPTRRGAAG